MTGLLAYTLGQKFWLDTPRTDSSLRRVAEIYKRMWRYPSVPIQPVTGMIGECSGIVHTLM